MAKKESNRSRICTPTVQWPATHSLKNTVTANQEEKLVALAVSLQVLPVPFSLLFPSHEKKREWGREGERRCSTRSDVEASTITTTFLSHKYVRANRCTPDIDASWRERVSFILIDYILPRDESGKTREKESLFLLLYFSLSRVHSNKYFIISYGFSMYLFLPSKEARIKNPCKNMGFLLPSIICNLSSASRAFISSAHSFLSFLQFPYYARILLFQTQNTSIYCTILHSLTHSYLLAILRFFLTKENSSSHQPPCRKLKLFYSFSSSSYSTPLFSWL